MGVFMGKVHSKNVYELTVYVECLIACSSDLS